MSVTDYQPMIAKQEESTVLEILIQNHLELMTPPTKHLPKKNGPKEELAPVNSAKTGQWSVQNATYVIEHIVLIAN